MQKQLAEYLDASVKRLVANIAKNVFQNPQEASFLLRFAQRLRAAGVIRAKHEEQGRHIPAFLIASIADTCNLSCSGCYARASGACGEGDAKGKLTPTQWGRVFSQAEDLGIPFILLAGGEPLLEKETLHQAAAIKDVVFPVFTNGTMLQGEMATLFEQNRNLVPVISIEGSEKTTEDRRGAGVYEAVLETMHRMKSAGVLFGASITVTTQNMQEVTSPAFMQLLQEAGCSLVFFVEYVPMDEVSEGLAPGAEERLWMAQQTDLLREEFENLVFLSFPGDEEKLGGCLAAGRGFFHLSPYGDAEPCPFSPYSIHNLKEHSVLEVLASPFFAQVREIEEEAGMPHLGGCALFYHRQEVQQLVKSSKPSESAE